MTAQILTCYVFASESDCKRLYQTLVYDNGSLSCSCKGWTFKRSVTRSCRHTRLVEAGLADRQCLSRKDYGNPVVSLPRRGENMFAKAGRKLDLTE